MAGRGEAAGVSARARAAELRRDCHGPRARVVAAVVAAGSEKAAAHRLGLSHSTVKHHLASARSKVGRRLPRSWCGSWRGSAYPDGGSGGGRTAAGPRTELEEPAPHLARRRLEALPDPRWCVPTRDDERQYERAERRVRRQRGADTGE